MSRDWTEDWQFFDESEFVCDSCGWAGDSPRYIESEYGNESACICPYCGYILEI